MTRGAHPRARWSRCRKDRPSTACEVRLPWRRPASIDRSSAMGSIDDEELGAWFNGVLTRHPAVGLAVVEPPERFFFEGRGLADVGSLSLITEDTVFRVGSKLFTALAVMQLEEVGLVDLDAPASEYLRAYRLIPAHPSSTQVTLRHLLTHTAGIPEVRQPHPSGGGARAWPPSSACRSDGRCRRSPSTTATGIVHPPGPRSPTRTTASPRSAGSSRTTGMSLAAVYRERIFQPLGMEDTDLVRSERIAARLAIGYTFGRHRAEPVLDSDWTARGRQRHGRILNAETLADVRLQPPARSPHPRTRARVRPGRRRRTPPGRSRRDPAGVQLRALAGAPGRRRRHRVHERLEGRLHVDGGGAERVDPAAAGRPGRGRLDRHPRAPRDEAATTGSPRRSPTSGDGWRSPRAWRCLCAAHLMIRALVPVPALYRGSCCIPTTRTTPPSSASTCRARDVDGPRRVRRDAATGRRRSTRPRRPAPVPRSTGRDRADRSEASAMTTDRPAELAGQADAVGQQWTSARSTSREALTDPAGRFDRGRPRGDRSEAASRAAVPAGHPDPAEAARWTRLGGRSERRSPRARSRRPAAGRERRGRGPRAHRGTPEPAARSVPTALGGVVPARPLRRTMYVRLHHSRTAWRR